MASSGGCGRERLGGRGPSRHRFRSGSCSHWRPWRLGPRGRSTPHEPGRDQREQEYTAYESHPGRPRWRIGSSRSGPGRMTRRGRVAHLAVPTRAGGRPPRAEAPSLCAQLYYKCHSRSEIHRCNQNTCCVFTAHEGNIGAKRSGAAWAVTGAEVILLAVVETGSGAGRGGLSASQFEHDAVPRIRPAEPELRRAVSTEPLR